MIKTVVELLHLLTQKQRKELLILQLLVTLMAFAEIAGIASIGPFMALIGNIDILQGDNKLAHLYRLSGIQTPGDFIVCAGLVSLGVLTVSAAITIFATWRLSIYGQKVGFELGDRLYEHYMYQPWLFHASSNSALLTKNISTDTLYITHTIIQPLLLMNAKIVLATFISVPIIIFNPLIAFAGLAIFASAYWLLYRLVRLQLGQNGLEISNASGERYSLMSEGFGGIKEVLLLGRQRNFIKRFKSAGSVLSYGHGTNLTLTQAPRSLMEVVAFGAVIFLVLHLVKSYDGNLGTVLPTLAVYALAGFKLLPAFQNIYYGIASIKSGLPSFEEIKKDLQASQENLLADDADESNNDTIRLSQSISLQNIEFTYPGKNMPAVSGLNMEIPVKKVVGIVGATGSGKSTVIDIILGLIQPDKGRLCIDGKPIEPDKIRSWQNALGFVPQNIFLANTSLLENVAFGLSVRQIDVERAKRVISLAHLDELVSQLPQGINTIVGERGVQLSGGQRQRIGIARSLYHDAEVLILDEATSALDGITEKFIMEAIHDFSGSKTIIMIAHRFATVQKCDIIFMMDHGRIVDQGTYNELFERNASFKRMALHS